MEQNNITNLKELELYNNLIGSLRFKEYKGDQYIKDYIYGVVLDSFYIHELNSYMEELNLTKDSLYELSNKLSNIFLKPEADSLYDNIYDLLLNLGFDHMICYNIKEFYDLLYKKVHYKSGGLLKGSYYYYNEFNINIESDTYIFIDHNNKKVYNLNSLSYKELDSLLNELLIKYIDNLSNDQLMDLINLLNIINKDDSFSIEHNTYNCISILLINKHTPKLSDLNESDPFIYIDNIYDYKIKTIKEEDLFNYLDMDLLIDLFMEEDPELMEFIESTI